jgi:hypothetical protein
MITPAEFDTLVRDTLRDVDAHTRQDGTAADRIIANAREGTDRVVPFRRRTGWIAPLIAAAAVAAVAVAVAWANHGGGGAPVSPATQIPSTSVPSTSLPTTSAPTVPTPKPSVQNFTTTSLSYLDAQHGWALGDGRCPTSPKTDCATILRTVDGGATWQPVGVPAGLVSTTDSASCGTNGTSSGPCVDGIVFASQKIGYLWSYRGSYMTTDGGARWTNLAIQQITQIVVVGQTALRLTTLRQCSAGCQYGVFAAPVGTTKWKTVIPNSQGHSGGWQLAGNSGAAYVLEDSPAGQALYRSTDGTHWTRVTTTWPCGNKAIDTIHVDLAGSLLVTCF